MTYWTSFGKGRSTSFLGLIVITSFFVLLFISKETMPKWEIRVAKENLSILKDYRPNIFCKDIFMIQKSTLTSINQKLDKALENIDDGKQLKTYMSYVYYGVLSTLIPSLIQDTEPFKGINGSSYTIPQGSKLDRMNWKLPYLPCRLREFKADDVHTCVHKKNQQGKKLRIFFIGDSRLRRPMEHLLEVLNKYNLTITTESGASITIDDFLGDKGIILWPKYKQKLDVRSPLLPNFHVSFMWAPFFSRGDSETDKIPTHKKYFRNKIFLTDPTYKTDNGPLRMDFSKAFNETAYIANFKSNKLNKTMKAYMQSGRNNGALDEIKRLLKRPQKDLPDFIFIGSSAWELSDSALGLLRNLDFWGIQGTQKIYKVLEELGSRTTVILLLPHPFKDFLRFDQEIDYASYFKIQNNNNQQWYINAQLQLFPKNIHIWDSFLPIAYSSLDDCTRILNKKVEMNFLPKIARFSTNDSYMCTDRMHIGQEAISTAVQMILNHVCNGDMDLHKDQTYCCDSY